MKLKQRESPAHLIFRKRSRAIYNGMKRRAVKEHGKVPFSYPEFVHWLLGKFFGTSEGLARCEYSGEVLTAENFFVDHKDPISRGGSFSLENLEVCSERENLRKGNMNDVEYAQFRHHVQKSGYALAVIESIWRRLEVGDVQRFSYFRRQRATKKGNR